MDTILESVQINKITKPKILIVDDEFNNLCLLEDLLTDIDAEIVRAENGVQALDAIDNQECSLILIDVNLPDINGFEIVERIRKKQRNKLIPIIFISAMSADKENLLKGIETGAVDFITKPITPEILIAKVRLLLEHKKIEDEIIESSNKFRSLFEVSNDYIFILDKNEQVKLVNPAAMQWLGYTENELSDIRLEKIVTESSYDRFKTRLPRMLKNDKSTLELELVNKNGKKIVGDCSSSIIYNADKGIAAFVVVSRDITVRKRYEHILNKAKERAEAIKNEITNELDIAKQVQDGLYPKTIPIFDGVTVAAQIMQASQVGGDYYDIIPINDHEIALLVVDVAGHDLASAFIVGMAKISFSAHIPLYGSLVDVMNHVNADMLKVIKSDRFLSAFCAVINTHKKSVRYTKAGHFDQILYRARTKKLELLSTEGMLIGAFDNGYYQEKTCQLYKGDKILLFTDGLFENVNRRGEQYSEERLYHAIQRLAYLPVNESMHAILDEQKKFCGTMQSKDDICLIIGEIGECSYNNKILPLFNGERPSMPPVYLNQKNSAEQGIENLLSLLDQNHYNDSLIRHYRKILHSLLLSFWISPISKSTLMRLFVKVDLQSFTAILVTETNTRLVQNKKENRTKNDHTFFNRDTCRNVLMQFDDTYGTFEINELGDRLLFKFNKDSHILHSPADVSFESRSDGEYLIVPENIEGTITAERIFENFISQGIVNAEFDTLKKVIKSKSGKAEKIGEVFRYYNSDKESLYLIHKTTMEATITLKYNPHSSMLLTEEDIRFILRKNRIIFGINNTVISEVIKDPQYNIPYSIAQGTQPVHGTDAQIRECVKIRPTNKPFIREDGSVDHKILDNLQMVKGNDCILEKIPPTKGKAGMSIFGRILDARIGKDKELPYGENTIVIDHGTRLLAKTDGYLFSNSDGIHVRHILCINSNIDYSTGNINYSGDIVVEGNVLSGFNVTSDKRITIHGEVEGARIESKTRSIICYKGMLGKKKGEICAHEDIHADFIQEAQLQCEKNLYFKKSLLHVKANVGGSVKTIERDEDSCGLIIGGEITVKGSMDVMEIGSAQQIKTIVQILPKHSTQYREKLIDSNKRKSKVVTQVNSLQNQLQIKAKLFKVKAKKTQKDKDEIETLLKEFSRVKKQLQLIDNLIQNLKKKDADENTIGAITVMRGVHPNVIIRFSEKEHVVHTKMGPTTFIYEDGKIFVKPFVEKTTK